MAAQLIGFHFIDKAGGIAGYIEAQGLQKPVVKSVQLKADAAAVVHNNLIEHIMAFERGDFAVKTVKIFIGNIFEVRVLQFSQGC